MIRLTVAGLDTLVTSPTCARCPSGPAGCCAAPPALTWVDLGRIANHGGTGWILFEIEAGRLRPCPRGLAMARVNGAHGVACTYLGQGGCVLAPNRRSSTCNEYLCDDALAAAEAARDPLANAARTAHADLERLLGALDADLAQEVAARKDGPLDASFFAWLGSAVDRRLARQRGAAAPHATT